MIQNNSIFKPVLKSGILLIAFACFCVPLSSFQTDTQPQYLPVKVSKNMTVEEVLQSYMLDGYDCNVQQFLKINELNKAPAALIQWKSYNLPILIYTYNNISIRSSIGIGDLEIAQAIQAYNADLLQKGVRKQSYKESGYLYVPYHLLHCKDARKTSPKKIDAENELAKPLGNEDFEKLTPKSVEKKEAKGNYKTRTYAIFGKNYQEVPMMDKTLKNKIFYVEGGHGGPDPGAQTKVEGRTLCEDEYAYDVSLRVARELIKHGATVYLINRDNNDGIRDGDFLLCDTDEQTYPDLKVPYNHKARLTQRSDAVNLLYDKFRKKGIDDQRLIVIHVDSRGRKEQIDTFLYYQSGNEDSYTLAKKMKTILESHYKDRRAWNGSLTTRDLHMLRETKPTTVFVEIGNIRNEFDRQRIMLKNNRQAIANWLAEGFMSKI